jgi:hypothetical protein
MQRRLLPILEFVASSGFFLLPDSIISAATTRIKP